MTTPAPAPRYATDYTADQLERKRQTLLQVLVALGDFYGDVVLVGGLVPALLVDQAEATTRDEVHVGSIDVDLGIRLAVVAEDRYEALAGRLRSSGFEPDVNENGNPAKHRWVYAHTAGSVVIDFLIDETETEDYDWGRMMHLTDELAALRTLGLALAFQDTEVGVVSGETLEGDSATRPVRVCGPAAFVVLKALAFRNRAKPKDAYDLSYVVRNWDRGPEAVAERWRRIGDHPAALRALSVLQEDFADERSVGPRSASRFLGDHARTDYAADVVGDISLFLLRARGNG